MNTDSYEIYSQIRDSLGYKDSNVASGAGITKSTFSDWKAGRYVPKTDKMQKIADFLGVSLECLITGNDTTKTELNARDERDIAKDLESIMNKMRNGENGPASFEGEEIPEEDLDLFAGQLELMLRRLKTINKEKYNPYKNKK